MLVATSHVLEKIFSFFFSFNEDDLLFVKVLEAAVEAVVIVLAVDSVAEAAEVVVAEAEVADLAVVAAAVALCESK